MKATAKLVGETHVQVTITAEHDDFIEALKSIRGTKLHTFLTIASLTAAVEQMRKTKPL